MKEEQIVAIKVFTPNHPYHHTAYYGYDEANYGRLRFGEMVLTSMGVGVIIEDDVSDEKLPMCGIDEIFRLANEKEKKQMERSWWNVILEIHQRLKEQE